MEIKQLFLFLTVECPSQHSLLFKCLVKGSAAYPASKMKKIFFFNTNKYFRHPGSVQNEHIDLCNILLWQ